MALNERQSQILDIVEKRSRVTVGELAQTLYVSEMTVRRDLKKMENDGVLKRYHGGAVACNEYLQYPIDVRIHINEKEKRDIATKTEAYIADGSTIFLETSSTCAHIIPHLKQYKNIKVITNSIHFLLKLSRMNIRCILTGGEYCESERSLTGRVCENFLRGINTDIAIVSCDGISDDGMITDNNEDAAEIVRIVFQNAKKKIILADHSKLGLKYTYNICSQNEADDIIIF